MLKDTKELKSKDGQSLGFLNKYVCDWCNHDFEHKVRTVGSNKEGKRGVSTQIVCPRCKNFIKTWS